MSITLYKAATEFADVLDRIDPETGELPPEYGAARELVERKGAAVAAYIAQREMEADAIEARLKEIAKRAKAMRARAAHLRKYMADCMKAAHITEISSADELLHVKLYVERDEAVDVYDEGLLPNDLIRVTVKNEPDKTAIRAALKAGQYIPGAVLVRRDRLVIE